MRIVHIGKYYPPDRGGMESFLQALARSQVQYGHSVEVLAHTTGLGTKFCLKSGIKPKTKAGVTVDNGVKVRRCKVAFNIGSYAPIAPTIAFHSFRHLLGDSDIIHVHSPNAAIFYYLFAFGRPIVLHWHSDAIFPKQEDIQSLPFPRRHLSHCMVKGWRIMEKLCLKKASSIVVTSQEYLDSNKILNSYSHKCRVIPLALGEAVCTDFDNAALVFLQKKNSFSVLAVGRLLDCKGFDVLIKALSHVPDAHLCIVGQGEYELPLRLLAEKSGLSNRVYFAGDVSDNVLRACYQACQCFVLPSMLRTETFGMAILEAMRESKACVVSHIEGSGMGSMVLDGITGFLYPTGNIVALSEALNTLATNEKLCVSMGESGYIRWKSIYNMDNVRGMFDDVYRQILNPSRHGMY